MYKKFDLKCKEVLGYSINEILYRVTIAKNTSFNNEVFHVVDGLGSSIFDIKDSKEAKSFCTEIANYLTRNPFSMLSVCGDNKTGEGTFSDNVVHDRLKGKSKDFRSARKEYTSKDLESSDISDMLEEIGKLQETLRKNLGIVGRSSNGITVVKKIDLVEYKSEIPWQGVLYRRMNTLSLEKEYSKKRVNRRQPERLELSGKKKKRVVNLVIAIDESGSISDDEYCYFISEISSIVKNFNCNIHLYEFTNKVVSYTFFKNREAKQKLKSENSVFSSRFSGGTSYQPVFDDIESNSDIDKNSSLVVIFTDGEGEAEVDYGKCKNRLWVVTKGRDLSCVEDRKNVFSICKVRRADYEF